MSDETTKELTGAEHFKNFLFLLFGGVLLLAVTVTTIKVIKHKPTPKPAPVVIATKDFHAGDAVLCENKFATVIWKTDTQVIAKIPAEGTWEDTTYIWAECSKISELDCETIPEVNCIGN